jgi:hypothetical protein
MALIVINNGTQTLDLDLAASSVGLDVGRSLRARLPSKGRITPANGILRISLPGRSSAIYSD